eukprot:jgi/Chrzof1/4369/Cz14g10190.t1
MHAYVVVCCADLIVTDSHNQVSTAQQDWAHSCDPRELGCDRWDGSVTHIPPEGREAQHLNSCGRKGHGHSGGRLKPRGSLGGATKICWENFQSEVGHAQQQPLLILLVWLSCYSWFV